MAELTGEQSAAKFAAITGILFVSAVPFTTDVNLIVPPSPYSTAYFATWAAASGLGYWRFRRHQMVKEITGPLAIIFCLLSVGTLFA